MKKLVVITGASSGFGCELAKLLSERGYALALLARSLDKMQSLKLPECMCFEVDVTSRTDVFDAIRKAESIYGDVDCIVNNAGVMLLSQFDSQSFDECKKMIDVNLLGIINGMQAVLPSMRERKTGTIINVSSIAGIKTFEFHAAYSATKFAVHGLSESVRWEVAPDNVRVITISPGAAETELLSHVSNTGIKDEYKHWKESIGGVISAVDVANTILFAYELPQHVCIRDLQVAPTKQQN